MNQPLEAVSTGINLEEELRLSRQSVFRVEGSEACCCTCEKWAGLREREENFFYSLSNVSGTCMLTEPYRITPTYGYCDAWEPVKD